MDFRLSQGSVATYCRLGKKSLRYDIENFLTNLLVIWKSVHICQSYYQTSRGLVFLEHGVHGINIYQMIIAFMLSGSDKLLLLLTNLNQLRKEKMLSLKVCGDLDVEMDNVLFMHVLQSFTDLSYVANHLGFSHLVVLICDLVKQLAAGQAVQHARPTCRSAITNITV